MLPLQVLCPGNCSGHGACRRGRCRCYTGYTGLGCERAAPLCPTACSGHGRCDTAGVCHCHKGYSGEACDFVDVSACPFGCSAHGSCSVEFSNGCECRDGTAPPDCAVVRAPHAADNGPLRLLVHGVGYASIAARAARPPPAGKWGALRGGGGWGCPMGCSGQGICVLNRCACVRGHSGAACEVAVKHCASDCNGHGECVDGKCQCAAGWSGAECAVAVVGPTCDGGCGGHGSCVAGACICEAAWRGRRCDEAIYAPPRCVDNCSGRGSCEYAEEGDEWLPTCRCLPGWTGPTCAEKAPPSPACPKACCGHGSCRWVGREKEGAPKVATGDLYLPRQGTLAQQCVCLAGFGGDDCCTPTRKACPAGCNGRGYCDAASGACACFSGWGGRACDQPHRKDCSGHGRYHRGKCECEPGRSGDDCSVGSEF